MKNYADLRVCYPPQPSASADTCNTLRDLHNSSYHTQPHPILVKYHKKAKFNNGFIIYLKYFQGLVVQKGVNANPGLKVNRGFCFSS